MTNKPLSQLSRYELFEFEHKLFIHEGEFMLKLIKAKASNWKSFAELELNEETRLTIGDKFQMSDREDLHAKFFNQELVAVSDLDDIALQARRDEMAMIAFQARSCVAADDHEIKERKKKNGKFQMEVDPNSGADITSDAINAIKERQNKLSKVEKNIQKLIAMGVPEAEAREIYSARNIRDNAPSKIDQNTPANTATFAGMSNPFPQPEPEKKLKPGEIDWDKVVKQATEAPKPVDLSGLDFLK